MWLGVGVLVQNPFGTTWPFPEPRGQLFEIDMSTNLDLKAWSTLGGKGIAIIIWFLQNSTLEMSFLGKDVDYLRLMQ